MFEVISEVAGIVGLLMAVVAFVWEFLIRNRRRLGYRVQMNAAPADVGPRQKGAWATLAREDGTALDGPSLALLRIENLGLARIEEDDYGAPKDDPVGVRVRFPGRSVAGVAITELSNPALQPYFTGDRGLGMRDADEDGQVVGVVELPKVGLDRGAHYKVLVALERAEGYVRENDEPQVVGTVGSGVLHNGTIKKTESRTGTPRWVLTAIAFLAAVCLAEPFIFSSSGNASSAPGTGCASGTLHLIGSTAFKGTLQDAAQQYDQRCPGAHVSYDPAYSDSGNGFQHLMAAKDPSLLEFSDGTQPTDGQAVPRPVAIVPFSLVVNNSVTGVSSLTGKQIRDIFTGKVATWSDDKLGGPSGLPVVLVGRTLQSGTQQAFQNELLGGQQEPFGSGDCTNPQPGQPPVACQESTTPALLQTVAGNRGAIGYSDLQDAQRQAGVATVQINGRDASSAKSYPFKETEYAYTYGAPDYGSLAASFLDFLTSAAGQSIVQSHGDSPCADPANPDCEPS